MSAFAVCMNMFADRPVFIPHVQRGGSTHNLVAGRIRLEAAQSNATQRPLQYIRLASSGGLPGEAAHF